MPSQRPRIGVSACLLGQEVRFDGGHKRDRFLIGALGAHVDWVPVCPEVEFGLGVPRETLRLEGNPESYRLVSKSGRDITEGMTSWSRDRLEKIEGEELDGYILKKDSPSCGLFRVRVYDDNGIPAKTARGLFARELTRRFPNLPIEEEGRLNDPRLRENFVTRILSHRRERELRKSNPTVSDLMRFHARHKYLLLAHSERVCRRMGKVVAAARRETMSTDLDMYFKLFHEALATPPSVRSHCNVLYHILGFLRGAGSSEDRRGLREVVEDYRRGLAPLTVPLTLIFHYVSRPGIPQWLKEQVYFRPHPKDLGLRNVI